MNPLFTIGHSDHELADFIAILQDHQVGAVGDVRSQPYSGRFPQFSRQSLEVNLREHGIRYVFLGKELGARRDEPECYIESRADYERISDTPAFKAGIERIRKGLAQHRIALMCAERDPLDCHRSILVCRHARTFAEIQHMRVDGSLESHAEAEIRLLERCKLPPGDLFITRNALIEEAYTRRGREIAWVEKSDDEKYD